jgi:hypothetical protein
MTLPAGTSRARTPVDAWDRRVDVVSKTTSAGCIYTTRSLEAAISHSIDDLRQRGATRAELGRELMRVMTAYRAQRREVVAQLDEWSRQTARSG